MKKTVLVYVLALGFLFPKTHATDCITFSEKINLSSDAPVNNSPLCLAVIKGDKKAVENLINMGEDVNQKSNGMLPIHYAAKYNRVDIIRVLITAGSEIHTTCDKGFTALRYAQMSKAFDAEQFLKRFKN